MTILYCWQAMCSFAPFPLLGALLMPVSDPPDLDDTLVITSDHDKTAFDEVCRLAASRRALAPARPRARPNEHHTLLRPPRLPAPKALHPPSARLSPPRKPSVRLFHASSPARLRRAPGLDTAAFLKAFKEHFRGVPWDPEHKARAAPLPP